MKSFYKMLQIIENKQPRIRPDFDSFTDTDIQQYVKFFSCNDCGVNVACRFGGICEYNFMLNPETWQSLNLNNGLLCIGCIEKRLGRKLTPNDFDKSAPVTSRTQQSQRLRDRIGV
jgi:hypothetical protein